MGRKNKKKDNKATPTGLNSTETEQSTAIVPLLTDDTSTVPNVPIDEVDLEDFRQQWQEELAVKQSSSEVVDKENESSNTTNAEQKDTAEEQEAAKLFLEAVDLERKGEMSEAVRRYTRAFRLVPDIEKKVSPQQQVVVASRTLSPSRNTSTSSDVHNTIPGTSMELAEVFSRRISERGHRFQVDVSNEDCPFNILPNEIIEVITRYVVSEHIHHKDLAVLSSVCSMFYLTSRSPEIWRRIYLGSVCQSTARDAMIERPICWRSAYLTTPHLMYHGVYVSKTCYIRHGETGFQDASYRPWHTVVYYRLIRFYPDGTVLMTTTSEIPQSAVSNFRRRAILGRTDVLSGKYRLDGTTVNAELQRQRSHREDKANENRRKKKVDFVPYGISSQTFNVRFRMVRAPLTGLVWEENVITIAFIDGTKSTNDLEVEKDSQSFPPLKFYRVKAFTQETAYMEPLQ